MSKCCRTAMTFNLFSCFYLIVLGLAHAKRRFGKDWESNFLALQTCRNLGALCAAGIAAQMVDNAEPACLQERPIEEHFGRVKSHYRGAPTIRDSIHGTFLQHLRQLNKLNKEPQFGRRIPSDLRAALSPAEISQISKKALASACQFQAFIVTDQSPDDVFSLARAWWSHEGASLFQCMPDSMEAVHFSPNSVPALRWFPR